MKLTSSVGCDGVLKCPSLGSTVPGIYSSQQAADGNTTKLTRFENKDLSACIPVGFNLDFQNSGKTVFIAWDEVLQPYAVLEADTDFPLELVDPLTGLPKRTQVAWELDTTTNQPKYIDAPSCLSSTQPAQYGTIATAITSASTVSIAIAAASLPNAPFSMIVASATGPERMLVQSYTGPVSGIFTASVVRGTGGTVPVNHAVGDKVASTPAPIINSGPYAGKQAEVCLIEENVLTQVFGTTGCPTQAANAEPLACVKVQSRFFIIGDPWLSRQ